ncbi:MAG TPA: MBL fold metallo-hydrolase [Bacteroidetes bacterium]|nr:MBL fold metallo-hydrolase [Bacteroidota bacterium]
MTVEQLYTNCLSEAAYFISSNGEAAVVDPLRDYQTYIDKAEKMGVKIKYVFETHFHADFVSGHIDLAAKTGAQIIYGPNASTEYKVYVAKDGEKFKIGNVELEVLHTPGHTPESSCYLLKNEEGKQYCVFSGDTLFVGDVGRPDLFGAKISKEELAGMMFDSLNNKIKKLNDDVIVYPAHGPGSSCGKNLGKETFSTIGEQRKMNYALKEENKENFVASITSGLSAPPQYFPLNAQINKSGYSSLDSVMSQSEKALSVSDFENEMKQGALVLDTRIPDEFELGFVKGAINIGLNGRYAEWVGTLIDINQPLLIVAAEGKEHESILRLARVGYEKVIGYLNGGFDAWKNAGKSTDMVISIDAEEFALDKKHEKNIHVIDVRKESEYDAGHVEDAENCVLQNFEEEIADLNKEEHLYIHCQAGYRSMIAASILKRKGFHNLKNVYGGYAAIAKHELPIVVTQPAVN